MPDSGACETAVFTALLANDHGGESEVDLTFLIPV